MGRVKLYRNQEGTGNAAYPLLVCEPCGKAAAEDSKTEVYEELVLRLGACGICAAKYIHVTEPQQFGFPSFYTYMNGQPIRRRT